MDDLTRFDEGLEIVHEGDTWRVVVVKAGRSLNGNLYTKEVLQSAAALFEGRPIQAFEVAEGVMGHLPVKVQAFLRGGLLKATVGVLRDVKWDEGAGALVAEAVITSPWLTKILSAVSNVVRGPIRTFGLSISAAVEAEPDDQGRAIKAFRWVDSVDVVTTPAAGGEFTRAVEALMETEAMDPNVQQNAVDVDALKADTDAKINALKAELAAERHQALVTRVVESVATGVNESTKTLLRKAVSDLETEDEIRAAAKAFIDGLPQPKPVANVTALRAPEDKLQAGLDGLLGVAESADVPAFRGIKDAYMQWTGDTDLTKGFVHEAASGQTSATFTVGFGLSMHKRVRKAYNQLDFGALKLVSTIQNVNDFKAHSIVGVGGFADLSSVSEDADYTELAFPAEEAPTLTVAKKGNLLTLTWESIVNDDLGISTRHADRLGRSARRTLEKAIFALFTANSGQGVTLWDSDQWFDSNDNHSNYGTTALGYASVLDGEAHIAAQTELTSSEPLGIEASQGGYVIGHRALRQTWLELTRGNLKPGTANNDGNALSWAPEQFVINPFATDLTDWYMLANPSIYESIVLGFLFGQREPEVIIADAATAYALFRKDAIEYKVRHVWGLSVVDYRNGFGAVVA